jgi:hypothetical protein
MLSLPVVPRLFKICSQIAKDSVIWGLQENRAPDSCRNTPLLSGVGSPVIPANRRRYVMRHQMVITDITRMGGRWVCVAGYLEDGKCVRPVCTGGPTEDWLQPLGSEEVTGFSVVELDLRPTPNQIVAPHTEDQWAPTTGHKVIRRLSNDDSKQFFAERCRQTFDLFLERKCI